METLYYASVQSPVGPLILGASEKGLLALEFDRGFRMAKPALMGTLRGLLVDCTLTVQ